MDRLLQSWSANRRILISAQHPRRRALLSKLTATSLDGLAVADRNVADAAPVQFVGRSFILHVPRSNVVTHNELIITQGPVLSGNGNNVQSVPVEETLVRIASDGADHLHVIFDFDMTMTKYWLGNRRNMVCASTSQEILDLRSFNETMLTNCVCATRVTASKFAKSSHGLFERSRKVSSGFKEATEKLFRTYYPIEVAPNLSVTEKLPQMVRWWSGIINTTYRITQNNNV
jgi:hypothetical protein